MAMSNDKAQFYAAILNLLAGTVPALIALGRNDEAEAVKAILARANADFDHVVSVADERTGETPAPPTTPGQPG